MHIEQVLNIFRARKFAMIVVALATIIATALVSFLLPKSYTATAEVVLDFKVVDPLTGTVAPPMLLAPAYIATQLDIIQSPRVGMKVVDALHFADNARARAQFQEETQGKGDIRSWLAELLAKGLDVKPGKESTLLSFNYRGNDPQFAATLANAFADAYVQTNLELRTEPARQNAGWFDDQIKVLKERLEKSQAKLSEFQNQNGLVSADERLDIETMRLNELTTQLVNAQNQRFESLAKESQVGSDATPEIVQNPLVQNLKAELARSETKLRELGERFGKNHPQYERQSAEIAGLRSKIAHEMTVIGRSVKSASESADKREKDVAAALAAQKQKVLKLKQLRDNATVLVREAENAQKVYDNAILRVEQTRLESRGNTGNATILTHAEPPLTPSSPKIVRNILLSVFLGVFLGILFGLALEMLDRRVRCAHDITELLAIPLLGTLSGPARKGGFFKRMRIGRTGRSLPELLRSSDNEPNSARLA